MPGKRLLQATKWKKWLAVASLVVVVGTACGGVATTAIPSPKPDLDSTPAPAASPTTPPAASPTTPPSPILTPTPTSSISPEPTFIPGPEPDYDPASVFAADRFGRVKWQTDFSKHSIDYDDILVGAPRDGIPAINRAVFLPVTPAPLWLSDREPVILLEINGDARAYPLQIMTWHEIVNDTVGGVPVIVTFCPLCNTALVFERTVNGQLLDFGTSGLLRYSDLIMYDRQTESWWQQIQGEAIVGALAGTKLAIRPAAIVSWKDFRSGFPSGQVLSRDTGYDRDYGRNPYTGYDDINSSPFLFVGPQDDRLRPMERVVTVEMSGDTAAYPFLELEKSPVVNDTVGGTPIVVFFAKGTASALDSSSIATSRDIGATGVFLRVVNGQELTFSSQRDQFIDSETGSRWNILGRAVEGRLAGQSLEPIIHANHFWFSWAAFKPETRVWRAP